MPEDIFTPSELQESILPVVIRGVLTLLVLGLCAYLMQKAGSKFETFLKEKGIEK